MANILYRESSEDMAEKNNMFRLDSFLRKPCQHARIVALAFLFGNKDYVADSILEVII
jgi:hypothetical protein